MRILAVDIGSGTQDILVFDSALEVENCPKLVAPSPTSILAARFRQATERGQAVLLSGVTMGGGPLGWALEQHLRRGLRVFATPDAARTFNDDLDVVAGWGVVIVGDDEAAGVRDVERLATIDFDPTTIAAALAALGIEARFDAVAVALLDHGAAPPGESDRRFRFQHLRRLIEERRRLEACSYEADELPPYLTRMKAVAASAGQDAPLYLLDSAVAAPLGALDDAALARHERTLMVNAGNMHLLGFHLRGSAVLGVFEHHTGAVTAARVDSMLERLVWGILDDDEVFDGDGHGCLVVESVGALPPAGVTGPRRRLMATSALRPHFATPHGDMMLTGCFGLLRAVATRRADWRDEIEAALGA